MDTHPIDPVALISGLLFGLAGLAILADQQWEDVDVTAFTGAGVMVIALLLAGLVVFRYVRAAGEPETINIIDTAPTDDEPFAVEIDGDTDPDD